jgi:hypothetical protein
VAEFFTPAHLIILTVLFLFIPVQVVPLWIIAGKADLQRWPVILSMVPGLGLPIMFYLALSTWGREA